MGSDNLYPIRQIRMPWQTFPSFGIIIAAFSVSGGLIHGIHKVTMGKDCEVLRDTWSFGLENRDERVFTYRKLVQEGATRNMSALDREEAMKKQLQELRASM